MTSYASLSDIVAEFKELSIDESSAVSITDVNQYIEQESAMIEMYLEPIYVLPVTGERALKILKRLAIALVAYRIAQILSISRATVLTDTKTIQEINGGTAYKQALKDLEKISQEKLVLPDATLKSNRDPYSYNSEQTIEPVFSTTEQQW